MLHTAWLNNRALTLKSNSTKYYFGEKSGFLQTFRKFCCVSRKILVKLKNILLNPNVCQTIHDLFLISDVPLQEALPPSVWQHNLRPFGREL